MTIPGDSRSLSAKQRRLLAAMSEHRTIKQAAEAAGVSQSAAYSWQRDPVFKQALHDLEHQTVNEAARQLLSLTGKATAALEAPKNCLRFSLGTGGKNSAKADDVASLISVAGRR